MPPIYRSVVVKVGTNVLMGKRGLDQSVVVSLVNEIISLRDAGVDVFLMTSAAIATGKKQKHVPDLYEIARRLNLPDEAVERTLSTFGQPVVMNCYRRAFALYGDVPVSQILLRHSSLRGSNLKNFLEVLQMTFAAGGVPIGNANDAETTEEIGCSENDMLAAYTAVAWQADALVILTDVDGVYDGSPKDPRSKLVSVIDNPRDYFGCVDDTAGTGRGKMRTKLEAAVYCQEHGVTTHIANGTTNNLWEVCTGGKVGTRIPAK